MLKPARGVIRFRGSRYCRPDQRKGLRFWHRPVAEGWQIFPTLSVRENLLDRLASAARPFAPCADFQRMFALFPRLEERAMQAAGTLSGGEQQMLAIARCLMVEPELIMFDEPSLGLAPTMVARVLEVIRDLNRDGMTCMLVEQTSLPRCGWRNAPMSWRTARSRSPAPVPSFWLTTACGDRPGDVKRVCSELNQRAVAVLEFLARPAGAGLVATDLAPA